jgi:hypothetical protein
MVYIFRSTLYDFEIDEGEAAKWGNEQSNTLMVGFALLLSSGSAVG